MPWCRPFCAIHGSEALVTTVVLSTAVLALVADPLVVKAFAMNGGAARNFRTAIDQ